MDGRLVPLTVDRLIDASSMVMLDSARRKALVPSLARVAARPGHRSDGRGQRGVLPWPRAIRRRGSR
jgi:hypothetical protein